MKTVQELAEEIVDREGGYVNDPDDPGGATNFGVTIHTMRRLGLDLNHDGRIDTRDVNALLRYDAVEIFMKEYFYGPRIHMLPDDLQPAVFDMQVNSGSNAVKILQRLLRDEHGSDIKVDGQIGPQTARIAHEVDCRTSDPSLTVEYGLARLAYYYDLGDRRPASRKYARRRDGGKGGWIVRAEEFLPPRWRTTEAQHGARTAGWK